MKITTKEFIRFLLISCLLYIANMIFGEFRSFDMVGVFTIACIILYRKKSLYIIFIYCLFEGLRLGFPAEWFPHVYIWILLYIITTWLVPVYKRDWKHFWIYIGINALHGLMIGALFSMIFGSITGVTMHDIMINLHDGIPYYMESAFFNALTGTLIIPIAIVIRKIDRHFGIQEW